MTNAIVIAILAVVLGLAIRYIVKAKKNGAKCIGCSACSGSSGVSGCGSDPGSCCCHAAEE